MTAEQRRDTETYARLLSEWALSTRAHVIPNEECRVISNLLLDGIAAKEEAERLRAHVCTDNAATLAAALAEVERLRAMLERAAEIISPSGGHGDSSCATNCAKCIWLAEIEGEGE